MEAQRHGGHGEKAVLGKSPGAWKAPSNLRRTSGRPLRSGAAPLCASVALWFKGFHARSKIPIQRGDSGVWALPP